MIKLIERVEAERERRGISFGKIESITGISSSVICDGLSGKTKEMRLENFISIVNVVYDKILERSTYINWFISLMENDKNKIKALFFLQAQGEYELLDKLILTYSNSKIMKNYLSIFEFYNLRNMGIKNGQELEIELDKSRFSTLPECQVLVNLLYGFCMYDIPNVQSMMTYSERAGRYLEKVENSFVKDCLKMMYKERLAFIKLLSDEVEESRAVCWDIINSETPYKIIQASAYGCLGEGFQFECVSTAEKYLLKGLDIIAANGIDRYWGMCSNGTKLRNKH
ncbi:AimR family lysis-lysogeny pheromone receptor [Bacillus cereus]|uniref:AimR family lysis-lysogeny pheromone receptor n=1 Tax=Bacillus cereus TaxID=1396 RepID=UPI003012FE5C